MQHAGLDPQRAQRTDRADAEQRVLGQARVGVAVVQALCDPPFELPVGGDVAVQQEERHPADVDAPDLRGDVGAEDGHLDRQWPAVGCGDERRRQARRVRVDPILMLATARVQALAEVALAVHQADRDERDGAIGGLLEQVAGQRSEAARVDGQRDMHAVLGAQEGHRLAFVKRRRQRRAG